MHWFCLGLKCQIQIINVIETNFPKDRTLDIRETTEFLEASQLVREGLKEGHSDAS